MLDPSPSTATDHRSARRSARPKAGMALAAVASLTAAMVLASASAPPAAAKPPKPIATVGELVVKLADGVDPATVQRFLGAAGADLVLGSRGIVRFEFPAEGVNEEREDAAKEWEKVAEELAADDAEKAAKEWEKVAKELAKDLEDAGLSRYAEANYFTQVADTDRFHYWPDGAASFLGTDSTLWTDQHVAAALGLSTAHEIATGAGLTVAVLDTGVDVDHPALAHRIVGGYDYIDDDPVPDDVGDGLDTDGDGHVDEGAGHGTHASGVVALVAPGADLWVGRVLDADGQGNVFVVAEAIRDAVASGADIINFSFGTAGEIESKAIEEALKDAHKAGVLLVAAAGNDATKDEQWPASDKHVLAVGAATDATPDCEFAWFSNHGGWVDVAAPGVDVISTLPGGYGTWSGTSMAAPVVAGQAALIWQHFPDEDDPEKIEKVIRDRTDKIRGESIDKGLVNVIESLTD